MDTVKTIFLHTCNGLAHTFTNIEGEPGSTITHLFKSENEIEVYYTFYTYRHKKLNVIA